MYWECMCVLGVVAEMDSDTGVRQQSVLHWLLGAGPDGPLLDRGEGHRERSPLWSPHPVRTPAEDNRRMVQTFQERDRKSHPNQAAWEGKVPPALLLGPAWCTTSGVLLPM